MTTKKETLKIAIIDPTQNELFIPQSLDGEQVEELHFLFSRHSTIEAVQVDCALVILSLDCADDFLSHTTYRTNLDRINSSAVLLRVPEGNTEFTNPLPQNLKLHLSVSSGFSVEVIAQEIHALYQRCKDKPISWELAMSDPMDLLSDYRHVVIENNENNDSYFPDDDKVKAEERFEKIRVWLGRADVQQMIDELRPDMTSEIIEVLENLEALGFHTADQLLRQLVNKYLPTSPVTSHPQNVSTATSGRQKRILCIDDHVDKFIESLTTILDDLAEVEKPLLTAKSPFEGREKIGESDLVLLDLQFPGDEGRAYQEYTGFRVLEEIRSRREPPPVIVFTDYNNETNIEKAHESECLFFLDKAFFWDSQNHERIRQVILSALKRGEREKWRKTVWKSRDRFDVGDEGYIVGKSEAMQRVYDQIEYAAESDQPVLVLGETGVGKELVARAIHHHWQAQKKETQLPFVVTNASVISTDRGLMISELFGCPWGYPNHDDHGRVGYFQEASGFDYPARNLGTTGKKTPSYQPPPPPSELGPSGTFFLDEIGDMPYEAQAMLLRVIQDPDGVATDLAGRSYPPENVPRPRRPPRLICATNRDLTQDAESTLNGDGLGDSFQKELLGMLSQLVEVTSGRTSFRTDLLRRLDVIRIEVPSLNERKVDDIELLIDYFCRRANQKLGKNVEFVLPATQELFMQCSWKDKNVRVLEILIEDCVRHSEGQVLEPSPQTKAFLQQ